MTASNKAQGSINPAESVDTVQFGFKTTQLISVSLSGHEKLPQNLSVSALPDFNREEKTLLAGTSVSSRVKSKENYNIQDCGAISVLSPGLTVTHLKSAYAAATKATAQMNGGSSGTTMMIQPGKVTVAWLGDSPAFLVGVNPQTGKIEDIQGLNEPHIPFYERAALEANGGVIDADERLDLPVPSPDQKNQYALSMSRAFGNAWLTPLLREPGIVEAKTDALSDKLNWYAVVGSDGVLMESERNLMRPRNRNAKFDDKDLITYCAGLFKQLVNDKCEPWKARNANWAENVTEVSQRELRTMEAKADKNEVGYAAEDDTTLLIVPLPKNNTNFRTVVLTVTDGHRAKGEETAAAAIKAIHETLAVANV